MEPISRRKSVPKFALIPQVIIESEEVTNLSGSAFHLLLILASQYNSHNNGDLSATYKQTYPLGFTSNDKLTKAKRELLESGLIFESRAGLFSRPMPSCSLYALAWQPIDECGGKHHLKPTNKPIGKFKVTKNKQGRHNGRFAIIPREVIEHPSFIKLTGAAKRVLVLYALRYRKNNNGKLFVSRKTLVHSGISSQATISSAIKQLTDSGLLICTRYGQFRNPGRCDPNYAISWQIINQYGDYKGPRNNAFSPFDLQRNIEPTSSSEDIAA